jgi:ABC-type sugar transport system permease subunit
VAILGADGWSVVAGLEVAPRSGGGAAPPWWLLAAALAAGWGLLALSRGWPARAAAGGRRGLLVPAVLAAVLLAAPTTLAERWAHHRLAEATDLRLAAAVGALDALPDLEAVAGRPGGVSRLTGLAFVQREGDGEVGFSTLLPTTARTLAALPDPPPARARVGRTPYALAARGPVTLVQVPFEHTHTPRGAAVAVVLAGVLLALLPQVLAPLAGERRALRRNLVAWAFLTPATLHLAVFTVGPLAFALWLSLHEWTLIDPARPFVGLANYVTLLGDGPFWNALRNTAVFTLHVPVAMAVALGFALLVHRRTRTAVALRAVFFLPSITSLVAIAIVWQWMLNDQYGLLNWALASVGLDPVPWLTSPRTALLSIMLLSVWMVVGYQMVLFQAGLAAIPRELHEAARIDGANAWQRFRHVTLPGLRHTVFFVLVTSVIGSFQVFGAVYVMTEGGPLRSTDVAVFHIYQEAWQFLRFGSAAAMSWILFALIFGVTWAHFRLLERRVPEGA